MAVIAVKIERSAKRQSAAGGATASTARRCLFGRPSDIEQVDTMSECRQHERLVDDEKQRQWNFDFRRMRPLPGRWQWELVRRPSSQQTPPGPSNVEDRRSDDAAPTATATASTPTPDELTSNVEPETQRKRRQTTLPGML